MFAWSSYGGAELLGQAVAVPLLPGALAIISSLIVAVSYFTTPLRSLRQSALVNYILFVATLVALVITTQGAGSAYIGIFVFTLACGAFFGLFGVLASIAAAGALLGEQYLSGTVDTYQLISLGAVFGFAIIAGIILWARSETPADETTEDRSYHELASELSAVAGKSEVVINAIGEGVVALDGQGMIQLINPAAQQLLGWNKHDAVKLNYSSILKLLNTKNQPVDSMNDPIAQALTTNKSLKNDNFSLQTQTGKSFLTSISVNPVGQLGNGVIVVFRDITTEKSDERQRAEFISTASHEMRTPVASIEGYLGLALNPATATIDDKARDFITKAHASAQHLGRLFADLLDVSKADDSRLKNDPKVFDVVPFVHDIVEGLTPKALEKGLRVLYKPIPDGTHNEEPVRRLNPVYYANVDNDHLREIVQNLVENAIKYTPQGEIVVDVVGDTAHIKISVTDSGIGIPKEDQAHLFQKFYRVDNSDTREIGGTGLGLYLCRRLTETIGGRIWVESEYKKGSTFYVELPRIDNEDAQRMIEQASIAAEREAASAAATSPTTPTVVTQPEPPQPPAQPPMPATQAHQASYNLNPPLTAIEENPRQYIAQRQSGSFTIPPRQQ